MLMIGKMCTQCVNFFMLPLYTAVLSTEEYGTADLIIAYISLLLPIVGLQLEQGLFRFLLDERENITNSKSLFSSVIFVNLIQIALFVLVFLPVNKLIGSAYSGYLLVLVPLQLLQATVLQYSRGVNRTDIYTIASFLTAFVQVLSNVVLIGLIRIGLIGLFLSMVIASSVCVIFVGIALKVWKSFAPSSISISEIKKVAMYSIPLIPNQLAWWIVNASDRIIVSNFIGSGANGIYSIACKFSALYITFYNYFNMSWTESVSLAINDSDRDRYINEMIKSFFCLIACLALGIIAVMPFFFPVMINKNYGDAYYQIPILMVAVFFQALQGLYSAIYVALKMTKEIAKTSIFSAIINIVIDVVLIKKIGLYAASFSTLIAFMSMAIFRYVDIQKYVKIKIDIKTIMETVVVSLIVVCAYYSQLFLVQLIALVIITAFSLQKNKKMLLAIVRGIKSKLYK